MRILVVDDHELVRKGICTVLGADATVEICGEAADGREAIDKAKALRPDVVVMDVSMPGINGLEATREIRRLLPETEVLILSQHDSSEMASRVFTAGARGFVVKSAISNDLLAAVRQLSEHQFFVNNSVTSSAQQSPDAKEILQRSAAFERALRESEERFRSAMNNVAEGVYTVDIQGRATYINPSAEAMLGRSAAELLGKNMHDVTHGKSSDGTALRAADCPCSSVLQHRTRVREQEGVFSRKDGSSFPAVFSASPMEIDGAIVGAVISFRDDTERRQAEDALRRSEQIYRGIGESIDYGVWVCDASGEIVYTSPSFLALTGMTEKESAALGWTHALHPEDVESTIAAWKNCVREGKFWEREHRIRGLDGKWHYVLARGSPIRDGEGKILYWAGINLDIQHRKEAERQLQHLVQTLEERILQRTRDLETASTQLRELSTRLLRTQDEERRRIARELHDGIGQLVAALKMNFANIAREKKTLSPAAHQAVEESTLLIEQASQEIRTMSYLLHPPLLDEVGLESALRWYVDGFSERSKIDIHLELKAGFSKALPRDLALALFRVVQECLTNVHRHSESVSAVVEVRCSRAEITLEIRDEGRGIPQEIQAKIAAGGSSGVGLRGMRERVRQFGGRLDVQSNAEGTRVIAVLPIPEVALDDEETEGEPTSEKLASPKNDAEGLRHEGATILCIDDEVSGLLPRKLLLESAGHRVIEARSGAEGIELFQAEKVDAVILDYWMSGMKGTTVASELKRINPAVPIIVLSGMSDLPGEAAGIVDRWLVKGSQRAEQLLDSISTLLDRRPV